MSYAYVAMFAAKAVTALVGGNKQAAAALGQETQGLQQEAIAWNKNTADNKAIAESNLTNQIRTGYKVGLLNVQQAQAKKRAMQMGFDLSKTREQAISGATANAAASGTIGPSVDAVISDIEDKTTEAQNQAGANYEQEDNNFETQLVDMLTVGQDNLRHSAKAVIAKTARASVPGFGDALFSAGVETGAAYASNNMSLGLGKSAGAT